MYSMARNVATNVSLRRQQTVCHKLFGEIALAGKVINLRGLGKIKKMLLSCGSRIKFNFTMRAKSFS